MLKCHIEDTINTEDTAEVYELMSTTSQDIMMKYSGCSEDIYESMLGIDPDCAEDLCKIYYDLINDLKNGGELKVVFKHLLLTPPPRWGDECSRWEPRGSHAQEVLPR